MKRELHVISNGQLSFRELADIVSPNMKNIDYLHIRERSKSTKDLYDGIVLLLDSGIPVWKLVMNDRIDIALLTGISRVQLGYQSIAVNVVKQRFPHWHVGCSVHSLQEALQAEEAGADSVMYGHIFSTLSKAGLSPRGVEEVAEITKQIALPVTAIGGIVPDNVGETLDTGVSGIAVMSGIVAATHPFERVNEYRNSIRKWLEAYEQSV